VPLVIDSAIGYDAVGRLASYEHQGPNGAALSIPDLPAGVRATHVLGYHKATYTYDANGNRKTAKYTRPQAIGAIMDSLNRDFTLDAARNRLVTASEGRTINAVYAWSSRAFTWDAAGHLLSDGINSFTSSAHGPMSESMTDGVVTRYRYTSAGQRVRKAGLSVTDYSYGLPELGLDDWPLGLYEEQRGAEFIYLPTASGPLPVAVDFGDEASEVLYAIDSDHLNTPRRLTGSDGEAVWQWVVTGFGEMPPTVAGEGFVVGSAGFVPDAVWLPAVVGADGQALPAVDFALRYPGQVADEETGLFYNHNRYYDPALAAGYTQADPLGLEAGWNRLGYVEGNALSSVDPEGLTAGVLPPPPSLIGPIVGGLVELCLANPVICAGTVGIATGTIIYNTLETPIANTIDWCVGTGGYRSQCSALLADVSARATSVRHQYFTNMQDPKNLYTRAYCQPNLGRRYGTWIGHEQKLRDLIRSLKKAIDAADAAGCPVNPQDRALLSLEIPRCPAVR
jgi:RHS repeat-associated protein